MEVHKPKFVVGLAEEILVIVVSICLALLAERTVEHYQHREEAKGVTKRMIEELLRDSSDLAFNIQMHEKALHAENALTQWSRHKVEISQDSLRIFASQSLIFTYFASNTAEIEALKGSGKLYLIEDPQLLSNILKHYDRYADFKLFTDYALTLSSRLADILRDHAALDMKLTREHPDQFFQFDVNDLEKRSRGNRSLENLLQQKTWIDWWIVERSKDATVRLQKVIAALRHEE